MLTTHLSLVLTLRVIGPMPLIPLNGVMKILKFSLLGPSLISWKLICICSMVASFMNCIDMHDHQHNNENETKL